MNHYLTSSLGILLLTTACASQPPAPIAHKGGKFYGKDGVVALAQAKNPAAPVFKQEPIAIAAPVEPMQVAELPEPVIAAPEPVIVASAPVVNEAPTFKTASFSADSVESKPAPVKDEPMEMVSLAPLPMEQIDKPAENPVAKAVAEEKKATITTSAMSNSNFIWPVEGSIVSRFGPKQNGLVNDGINIAANEGAPIWAAADGEVVYAGNELKGYGNMIIVRHKNGWMTAYAHSSDMLVSKGDQIGQGDLIGYVGKTGAVETAQLHFGIREGKKPVDPETLLPQRMASR